MNLNCEIKRCTLVTSLYGQDQIILILDLPTAFPEMQYEASATMYARKGYGATYCREVLKVEPEMVETK